MGLLRGRRGRYHGDLRLRDLDVPLFVLFGRFYVEEDCFLVLASILESTQELLFFQEGRLN